GRLHRLLGGFDRLDQRTGHRLGRLVGQIRRLGGNNRLALATTPAATPAPVPATPGRRLAVTLARILRHGFGRSSGFRGDCGIGLVGGVLAILAIVQRLAGLQRGALLATLLGPATTAAPATAAATAAATTIAVAIPAIARGF